MHVLDSSGGRRKFTWRQHKASCPREDPCCQSPLRPGCCSLPPRCTGQTSSGQGIANCLSIERAQSCCCCSKVKVMTKPRFRRTACTASRWNLWCRTSWGRWRRRSWWPPCTRSAPTRWEGWRPEWRTPPSGSSRPSGRKVRRTSRWWGGSRWEEGRRRDKRCWYSSPSRSGKASQGAASPRGTKTPTQALAQGD